jgi:hypothetical protein
LRLYLRLGKVAAVCGFGALVVESVMGESFELWLNRQRPEYREAFERGRARSPAGVAARMNELDANAKIVGQMRERSAAMAKAAVNQRQGGSHDAASRKDSAPGPAAD